MDIIYEHGEKFFNDFKNTYYYSKLRTAIYNSNRLYKVKEKKTHKGSTLFRLTFPLFILSSYSVYFIIGGIKWVLTGENDVLSNDTKIRKFFNKWNDLGGFNIL